MSPITQPNLKARKILFALLLALICVTLVYSVWQQNKPWVVPEEFKKLKNPLPPSESTVKVAMGFTWRSARSAMGSREKETARGQDAFSTSCDLSDGRRMSAVTDGEIFIKLPRAGGLCLLSKRAYLRISVGGLFYLCALFVFLSVAPAQEKIPDADKKQPRPRKTDFSFLTRPFSDFTQCTIHPPKEESEPTTPGPLSLLCASLPQWQSLLGRRGLHLPQRSRNFFQVRHHRDVVVLEPGHFSGFIHNGDRPPGNAFVRQIHAVLLARRPTRMKIRQSEYLMPIFSAYALCDHTLSTLTPSTSASSVSNAFISLTKQACSLVHVGSNPAGTTQVRRSFSLRNPKALLPFFPGSTA